MAVMISDTNTSHSIRNAQVEDFTFTELLYADDTLLVLKKTLPNPKRT